MGTIRSVADPGQVEFTVRGSRFIGIIAPAIRVDAAECVLEAIRNEYPDATHHVSAYRVPADPAEPTGRVREFARDDGEPTGSAGKPALRVLTGQELRNVVAVVVRYYGGTNLGIGGLVSAYTRSVTEAIEAAEIERTVPTRELRVRTTYDDSGTVRGILESSDVTFDAHYDAVVQFIIQMPIDRRERILERLRNATSDRIEFETDG